MLLKHISISLLAASIVTTTCWAGAVVTLPNSHAGSEFSLDLIYAHQSDNQMQYAITGSQADPLLGNVNNINSSFHPNIHAGFAYLFPHSDNSLIIDIYYANPHDHAQTIAATDQAIVPSSSIPPAPQALYQQASSTENFYYRAIDMLSGHKIALGQQSILTIVAGLRLASVDYARNAFYGNGLTLNGLLPIDTHIEFNNHFRGIGLEGGIESEYSLNPSFKVFTKLLSSLLYGEKHGTLYQLSTIAGVATPETNLNFPKEQHVFYNVDLTAGLRSQWQCGNTTITGEGGVFVTKYFNIIIEQRDNFTLFGPYIGIKVSL